MATDLRSLPANIADDATFRSWGSGIAAQFAAVGLAQASDTGQINWTTVTRPGTSTYAGYEIWRFNDSLQATKPVYIKIEYGVGASGTTGSLRVTVCTATNGSGTPSGQIGVVRTVIWPNSKSAGTTSPSYCSGSSNRLNLCTNLDVTNSNYFMMVMVERTRDAAGNSTGDGILTLVTLLGVFQWQIIPFVGTIPGSSANNPALDLNAGGSTVAGTEVLLVPTVTFYGKALLGSWCVYRYADPGISETASISVEHFGATHTYMPLGDGTSYNSLTLAGTAGYAMAFLWE